MNEIQDVKEVFGSWNWAEKVNENPKRIYGFLLCTDEHEAFLSFIQKAWRTLDALSGKACDIFTLEHWEMPHDRFKSANYLPIAGGRTGNARIADGAPYGFSGQDVAIDNGIMLPNRTQCLKVKETLFENPNQIILPGLALFSSAFGKEAVYYKCGGLDNTQLSEAFQNVFASVKDAYELGTDRSDIFTLFQKRELNRAIKERLTTAILKLSLKDIFSILSGSYHLVMPKTK